MVTIHNEIKWISEKAVVKISQIYRKTPVPGSLIILEALGQDEFKGDFKIFFIRIGSSMKIMPNVFSYVHQQFFRMPDLWRQKANKITTKKFFFLEIFLMIHDFLDMPKYFSNQLIIIHKQQLIVFSENSQPDDFSIFQVNVTS